jgi:hypothetical protein
MVKLRAIPGGKGKGKTFSLIFGVHLLPTEEVPQVIGGGIVLRDGTQKSMSLHILEGDREQIRAQVLASIDALFDRSSALLNETIPSRCPPGEEVSETGC